MRIEVHFVIMMGPAEGSSILLFVAGWWFWVAGRWWRNHDGFQPCWRHWVSSWLQSSWQASYSHDICQSDVNQEGVCSVVPALYKYVTSVVSFSSSFTHLNIISKYIENTIYCKTLQTLQIFQNITKHKTPLCQTHGWVDRTHIM